jgi:tetratricopeptide (TPR) repeat protein
MADKIGLKYIQHKIPLTKAHLELASYYMEQGDTIRAIKEVEALVNIVPYWLKNYFSATRFLIKARLYDEALPFLHKSLLIEDTGYANKWIGVILMHKKEYDKAIPFLEKAVRYNPHDRQLREILGKVRLQLNK